MSPNVQQTERKKYARHMTMLLRKKERLTNTETLFLDWMGVVNYSLIFVFWWSVLEANLRENRGMIILQLITLYYS